MTIDSGDGKDEPSSVTSICKGKFLLFVTGLGEEDVVECGSASLLNPISLSLLRAGLAAANCSVLLWSFVTKHTLKFHMFWLLSLSSQPCSIEIWAIALTSLAWLLLSITAMQNAFDGQHNNRIAVIAGPLAFSASTFSLGALITARIGVPTAPRFWIHFMPIFTTFAEIAVGTKLKYRIRAVILPIILCQIQQITAFSYIWVHNRAAITKLPTYVIFMFALAFNLVIVMCGIIFVCLIQLRHLHDSDLISTRRNLSFSELEV